jgi:hypothetical protein
VNLLVAHPEAGISKGTVGGGVVGRGVSTELGGAEGAREGGEAGDDTAGVAVPPVLWLHEQVDDFEAVAAGGVELGATDDGVTLAEGEGVAADFFRLVVEDRVWVRFGAGAGSFSHQYHDGM